MSTSLLNISLGTLEKCFFILSTTSIDAISPAFIPPMPSATTRSVPFSDNSMSVSFPILGLESEFKRDKSGHIQ